MKRLTNRIVVVSILLMVIFAAGCGAKPEIGDDIKGLSYTQSDMADYPGFKVPKDSDGNVYRDTYTMEDTPNFQILNSVTNHPEMGDERDFVRIAEKGSGGTFVTRQKVEPGKEYVVSIFVCNDASSFLNDEKYDYTAIAKKVTVLTYGSDHLEAGKVGHISGVVTCPEAEPNLVFDAALIESDENVKITCVPGSAWIRSDGAINGKKLDDSFFDGQGVFVGYDLPDGNLPGGPEHACIVYYTIKVEKMK